MNELDKYTEKREALIERLRKRAKVIFIAVEETVANDISSILIEAADELEQALSDKGDYKYKAMEEAMEEFVRRCEAGSVRSKYTYAKFKGILALPSPPQEYAMNELDKWSADTCEIYTWQIGSMLMFELPKTQQAIEWTLSDARCMEIFEAKFELDTYVPAFQDGGKWRATSPQNINGHGNTPKAARLACAQAIMEASK